MSNVYGSNKNKKNNKKKGSLFRDIREQSITNIRFKNNITFFNDTSIQSIKNITQDNKAKCYISLTTTPSRFYPSTPDNDEFMDVLRCLSKQTIQADKIYVSLCSKYARKFSTFYNDRQKVTRIAQIQNIFPNVEIIDSIDYGPATKILGLIDYNQNLLPNKKILNDNDLIIAVDDDLLYSRDLVFSHVTAYHTYNADVVAVNQNEIVRSLHPYTFNVSDIFFQDNYKGFLYGWLSFSMKFSVLRDIFQFYREHIALFPDIVYHDDLLFTLYTYIKKLYIVESRFVPLQHDIVNDKSLRDLYKVDPAILDRSTYKTSTDARTVLDSRDALRDNVLPSGITRTELENNVFTYYKIPVLKLDGMFVTKNTDYTITKNLILPRANHVSLVDNVDLIKLPEDMHVVFNYIDSHNMLMTVTVYNEGLVGFDYDIQFMINSNKYSVTVTIERDNTIVITKFSHVLNVVDDNLQKAIDENKYGYTIVQTSPTTNITQNKFYSISTVLNASINFPYKFFDDNDALNFVKTNFSDMVYDALCNLIPGAYFSDLFRYCYLYMNGGIYIDCKKTFYVSISKYIDMFERNVTKLSNGNIPNEIFIKDCNVNMAYNAIIICGRMSRVIKISLMYAVYMVLNNLYGKDPLCITGPGCMGDAVDYVYGSADKIDKKGYPYYYINVIPADCGPEFSFVITKDGYRVIKNTYHGYYSEGNYFNTNHYHTLWEKKKIYHTDLSTKYNNIKNVSDVMLVDMSVLSNEKNIGKL